MLHIKLTEIAHHKKKTRIILIKHAVEKLKITSYVTQTLWLLAQGGDDGDVVWLFIGALSELKAISIKGKRKIQITFILKHFRIVRIIKRLRIIKINRRKQSCKTVLEIIAF